MRADVNIVDLIQVSLHPDAIHTDWINLNWVLKVKLFQRHTLA